MKPKKVVENFKCDVCRAEIIGDGYTDHCSFCLWGKHADEEIPGDRASDCGGLMEPVKAEYEKGKWRIFYKCQKCGHRFIVDAGKEDNKERLEELMRNVTCPCRKRSLRG